MITSIGKYRRLQQCATAGGKFVILAMDHRGNLRQAINPAAPDSVGYAEMVRFKVMVTAALASSASAVLLDPEFGAAQAIAAGALPGQVGLVVAVEKTGYAGEPAARESQILPGWSVEKIARMGASAVKLLLYYHPEAANAAEQERIVEEVGERCEQFDIPFFLEPLSFSLDPAGKKLASPEKRRVVVETARRLTPLRVDVLKAEFPLNIDDEPDESLWAEACLALSEASVAPWVLLSASVGFSQFERQTRIACQSGACGVMAGRAVWKEAGSLAGEEREHFLRTTAKERMERLASICEQHGRPWVDFYPSLAQSVGEDWYKNYGSEFEGYGRANSGK